MGDLRLGERWTVAQRLRNDAMYAAAMAALFTAGKLTPRGALDGLGARLGRVASRALPAMRRRAEQRLGAAFRGKPPIVADQVFEALGRDLADSVRLLDDGQAQDGSLALGAEADAVMRDAIDGGRGVVWATAHLGPIERMAALVASRGFQVATLARESYDPRFTALYERLRGRHGVRTIYRAKAGADVRIVRGLRAGWMVGFPMDLAGRGMATTECEFLGERSRIPVGPARIAMRTGAALLVGTPAPLADGTVGVTVERVEVSGDERAVVGRIVRVLEGRILAWPEHWPWMHG